jgi:hypothetical protein
VQGRFVSTGGQRPADREVNYRGPRRRGSRLEQRGETRCVVPERGGGGGTVRPGPLSRAAGPGCLDRRPRFGEQSSVGAGAPSPCTP